jgi:hypothetical protein
MTNPTPEQVPHLHTCEGPDTCTRCAELAGHIPTDPYCSMRADVPPNMRTILNIRRRLRSIE